MHEWVASFIFVNGYNSLEKLINQTNIAGCINWTIAP
jgi:hypothetical protein